MKKARIFLSAIAVLAVVGGSVAFKAHSKTGSLFTGTTSSICNGPFELTAGGTAASVYYGSAENDCPHFGPVKFSE